MHRDVPDLINCALVLTNRANKAPEILNNVSSGSVVVFDYRLGIVANHQWVHVGFRSHLGKTAKNHQSPGKAKCFTSEYGGGAAWKLLQLLY